MPVNSALETQKQVELEFEASQDCTVKPYFRK